MKQLWVLVAAVAAVGCGGSPKLSESEEYYTGRAVAANVLAGSPLYEDEELRAYVTLVGYTVALASDRPETFKGYHFGVIKSDEINAFAAPSGFIFVTTGALRVMQSEDELAGVLAHEIAHVNLKHPELEAQRAANSAGWFGDIGSALGFGLSAVGAARGQDLSGLAEMAAVAGKVADITTEAVVKGYSRDEELAADAAGVDYVTRPDVRYDPRGLKTFVSRLPKGSGGAWSTHPELDGRIEAIEQEIQKRGGAATADPVRTARFKQNVKDRLK